MQNKTKKFLPWLALAAWCTIILTSCSSEKRGYLPNGCPGPKSGARKDAPAINERRAGRGLNY